jgi:hypothetical protein
MITTLLIALAAGLASAMMFASIVSGALISVLLFYLAPLPLMVAGLGWGPLSAAVGGISAATGLGLMFGMPYLVAFVVTVAIPAWWLGHLCLLGRAVTEGGPALNGKPAIAPVMEWYPVGRVLLWIAGFATVTTISALLTLGTDSDTILGVLKQVLQRAVSSGEAVPDAPVNANTAKVVDALAIIAPAAAGIVAIMTLTLNLWLAAKITATSGQLRRSWPDLKSAALPPMTLVALALALALAFVGGLVAIFGQIASATLMMAYALTGFAALHTLTLGMKSRTLWLSSAYAVVMVFGWPILALVGLGLADAFFGFRQRFLQRRPPTTAA